MRLRDDFSLELSELKPDDQGTYTCEIDVMGKPISITHKVQKMTNYFRVFLSHGIFVVILTDDFVQCARSRF